VAGLSRGVGVQKLYIYASGIALVVALAFLNVTKLNSAASNETLSQHQAVRDALFKTLKATATNYTFKYVVISLPAGILPGINFPIPVSHIRYESTVLFEFDKFTLQPDAEPIVSDLAKVIQKDTALKSLLIVGHTDAVGTDEYNVSLSKKRAFTVATSLQAAGVNAKYIHIIPMGKEQPFATNSTADGRKLNRRVEFFVSDIPEATQKAVQLIRFNPCFRNDYNVAGSPSGADCDNTPRRIPIFSIYSESKPTGQIELVPKPIERSRLPNITLERPPLQELDNSNPGR
jgi:outer membrane protein OmpA-like peptidoglycan-associated protein